MKNDKKIEISKLNDQEKTEIDTEKLPVEELMANSPKKKKKGLKIVAYAISSLILLFVIVIFSLGSIVKVAVNNVLPKVTGTPCSMGACTFNPVLGKITISNLKIGNPEGYVKKNAFKLERLAVAVNVTSLFSDMIVIEEITVKGMNVDFEVKLTETNLSRIKSNINDFTKKDEPTQAASPKETDSQEPATDQTADQKKKLRINLIQFADNSLSFGTAGKTANIPFANMTIKDIGSGPEGATVGEVSAKIFLAIYDAVLKTAKDNGMDSLKKSTGEVYKKVTDKVKGWFGGKKK